MSGNESPTAEEIWESAEAMETRQRERPPKSSGAIKTSGTNELIREKIVPLLEILNARLRGIHAELRDRRGSD